MLLNTMAIQPQPQVQDLFDPSQGTGKDVYYNSVQLEQINSMGKKKGGKIIVQEVDGGMWWAPLAAELLGPIVKKVMGGGECSQAQMEKKFRKELKAAGFFTDLVKNFAKNFASKAFQGVKTAAIEKGSELARKGAESLINKGAEFAQTKATELLNKAEEKIKGQGRKKKAGKIIIGGCVDGSCGGACDAAGMTCGGAACDMEAGTRKSRNALVKKTMKKTGKSLPEASADIKQSGAYKSRMARNALVKSLMKEEGLSLPMASKAVKERGLKY